MDKRYLIEVLLRARDSATQVFQKVARGLDDVTKAQGRSDQASRASSEASRRQITALEQLHEAHVREKRDLEDSIAARRREAASHRDSAASYRDQARQVRASADGLRAQRDAAVRAQTEALNEAAGLRDLARARQDQLGAIDKTVRQLTQQAEASRRIADQNRRLASSYDQSIRAIDRRAASMDKDAAASNRAAAGADRDASRHIASSSRVVRAIASVERQIERLSGTQQRASRSGGPFTDFLNRIGIQTGSARSGLRGLNAELQGFQLAVVIKYAQALISALIAIGAQFVAVAAAAGQAAVGIGAALAAGAAQAVPVIGVLAAAFSRLTSVLKIVKLQNQQQLTATHDATRAAKAQTTATDQIRSAEQRVAEAHRNTARAVTDLSRARSDAAREEQQAQRAVTQARKDAIRTVQDLMAAEDDAAQSLLQAQQSRQQAIETGDVMGAVQGDIDVQRARRDIGRAREDAAPVRARGVEGVDAVQQAEQRLADTRRSGARTIAQAEERLGDARRGEVQATQDLSRTRRQAADNLDQETAAADKLADSLAQLSPAERQLYRRILALQETYRRIARPITDIITRAFTGVVDRVNQLLQDPRIIRGFRNIAIQIAGSIRTATREAGGPRSVSAFQILSAEAVRNIPIATRILVNFFRAARNLVLDALPAFRLLLHYVEDYSGRALDASRNSTGIRDFFITGVRYARSFFELGLAVVRLLLTIAGRGGAASEGIRTIDDLTGVIDNLTSKARENAGSIRRFFRSTHDVLFEVLGVVGNLAKVLFNAFSPRSVSTFADFLNAVIIPALGTTLTVMGALVTAFHQIFSLPGVAQVARVAATALLLAQGFTIIQKAISSVLTIIPNFLRALGLVATAEEVAAGAAVFTPLGIAVGIIAAVTAAVYLLDRQLHFLGPTWRWIKRAAGDALDGIKSAAESVFRWFSDVWTQGLLYWIRWPFVWLARHAGGPAFRWIITAAQDVIAWLQRHFGRGGDFAIIGDLITLPFRAARGVIRLVFETIKTIIGGALDLIAGRFDSFGDRMSDFWATFIDIGRGAVSSLLGVVGDLLGALGKIPKIGGPFRDAADDIHTAQRSIDDLRDSTTRHRRAQERANDAVKDAAPILLTLRRRYEAADDRVRKLRPGTDAYKDAVIRARKAHRDYNEKLRDTANRSKDAQGPTRRLKRNIDNLGDTSSATADQIAGDLNSVLKEIGAKEINVRIRRTRRRSNAQNLVDSDNPLLGSPFRATGGIANPYGSPRDDHILVSPGGRAVAALSGTEGIVNTPQMGIIDSALSFTRQMTGMPWGSLSDLWGSGMRHYQGGGGLHPAIRNLSGRLDRMFGLTTTSTTGGRHATNSLHYRGLAADISGSESAMARATRYIRTSGIWRSLLEGIHNPGLSVKNGRMVSPSFWGADTWANHRNHIHIAASNAIAAMAAQIRAPRFTGLGNDVPSRIARRSARVLTRAANRYLQRQMDSMGGGDIQAQGADANVVAAFRRAARTTGANRKEKLALFESGIVESGLRNLHFGDRDSLGSLQERASIFGRSHALNPYASALRFLRDAISKRPWRGSAGALAQAVQRSAFPGRYDQVRGRAERYLQRGGTFDTVGPGRPAPRPRLARIPAGVQRGVAPIINTINDLFRDVTGQLNAAARGLRRSSGMATRLQRAFARITGQDGLLDQMSAQTEAIAARATRALQRRQFVIWRRGPVRLPVTDAQVAQGELRGVQEQRGGLLREQGAIQGGINEAERALAVARRRNNRRAIVAARAALANLRKRMDVNTTALAQNAQDQVEAQERFQQALVTEVNDAADRRNAAIDRFTRLATALGQDVDPNIALGQQNQTIRTQVAGLQPILDRARRTGNTALADQLTDQIAELNTQMAENTRAIKDNTEAAFNATTQRINDAFNFSQGLFSGVQGFFQAIGEATGVNTIPQQVTALQGVATSLATQAQGLAGQLADLLGDSTARGLTGIDLVNYVASISTGPAYQAILDRLDPTQESSFQDLVSALVGNATATVQNTQALQGLTGSDAQSFSSTLWSTFRRAIFTGAGGLLPQYQTAVPTAAVGAHVTRSGMMIVHAGENVRPAGITRGWQGGGDTYALNVTTPTEVLNPTDVGRQLAFYRKSQGRR